MKERSHPRNPGRASRGAPMQDRPDVRPQLQELARLIRRHCGQEGRNSTAWPALSLFQQSAPTGEPIHALHDPALCLIVQGAKQVILNGEVYSYDASRYLVVSLDVPITAQVTHASREEPYLCFRLNLEPSEIAALILDSGMTSVPDDSVTRAVALAQTSPVMLEAVLRLTRLLDTPEDIAALAPLAVREILYRLLKTELSPQLRQIAASDGQTRRISRVIGWLKANFHLPLRIEDIAREVHMSPSSLHHHFKAITAMSPLQFQKQLRLQEARRLMLAQAVDAATAGHRVGYESPSQFGREYARLFGAPPARDLRRLREQMPAQGAYGSVEGGPPI